MLERLKIKMANIPPLLFSPPLQITTHAQWHYYKKSKAIVAQQRRENKRLKVHLHFIRISDCGCELIVLCSHANVRKSYRGTFAPEIDAFGCFVFIRTFACEPKAPRWNLPTKIQLSRTREACWRIQWRLKDDDRTWLFEKIGYDF